MVMIRDQYQCQYCGAQATAVDHFISRNDGGSDDLDNLRACCRDCNMRKGVTPGPVFLEQQRQRDATHRQIPPPYPVITGDYS